MTHQGNVRQRSGGGMRRRGFIQAVGLSTALPAVARAQQAVPGSRIAKVGIFFQLRSSDEDLLKIYRAPLVEALRGLGYVEGKNVQFLDRTTDDPARLREVARELVDQ